MEIFAKGEGNGGLKRLELFLEAGVLSETHPGGWSLVLETLKDRRYAQLLRNNTHAGLTGLDVGKTLVKTSFAKRRIGCCTFSKKDWKTIMAVRRRRMR